MAFFGLFKSRQAREAELKTRVRQGTIRIKKFVKQLEKQADNYAHLAHRAYDLDDSDQFRKLATGWAQSLETKKRWERYMVTLEALELRRHESDATREFLSSMNSLTSSILNGVKPEDVAALSADMEAAMERSEELSEALADALEDSVTHVDQSDSLQPEFLAKAIGAPENRLESPSRFVLGDKSREQDFWLAMERQRLESDK